MMKAWDWGTGSGPGRHYRRFPPWRNHGWHSVAIRCSPWSKVVAGLVEAGPGSATPATTKFATAGRRIICRKAAILPAIPQRIAGEIGPA
jgi:hypothetical protein